MSQSTNSSPLRILHCFRSPVGGIFRHVRDLVHEQIAQGHSVGVICDNNSGGVFEDNLLAELEAHLTMGLHRLPMGRAVSPRDLGVIWKLYRTIKALNVDVLHSHGAKGGAYARLIGSGLGSARNRPARLYCPHGGSIHYDASNLSGRIYFSLERLLEYLTDRLIFVSEYERDGYFAKVGSARCAHSLVRNGLTDDEFETVATSDDATDFIYIGMMRDLKGVDLFLEALPIVAERTGKIASATLVGDGPDLAQYIRRADALGERVETHFYPPMPARDAFGLGRTLIVPSRAESMPYIVLEALAAQRPVIATHVGGIPEIYGAYARALVKPDSATALAEAMTGQLNGTLLPPDGAVMRQRVKDNFSAKIMANDVMDAYRAALAARS